MSAPPREAIQKQIQQDWLNREYIEVITVSIKKITDFLNSFDLSCRSKLAVLNEKLTTLERKIDYLEACTLTAKIGTRSFFHWVNMIFNQVDVERRKLVGPDRSCAEWLLRNGASIKWVGSKGYLTDYNCLPIEGSPTYYIEEVDATESSISHYGFEHFKDCKHVRKLILHKCNYIEDKALKELHYLKDTLRFLQVSSCHNVTEKGLDYLTVLNKLETLIIFDLPYVKEKDFVVDKLCKEVPKCNVQFN